MAGFLAELETTGRALLIELAVPHEPARWILAEEDELFRAAFPKHSLADLESRATIVRRFLQTHALVGLTDLTARYPIRAVEAAELLELWCEEGKVVRIPDEEGGLGPTRWAERGNLAEMRRATVATRRRESLAVLPEVFADFVLRRQHAQPATRDDGPAGVERALELLQGYAAPASAWESEILPRRIKDYRPAWLDEVLARGTWLWRAEAARREEPRVAFFTREFPLSFSVGPADEAISASDATILDVLDRHGATFTIDLARLSGVEPSQVRRALSGLMRRGLVTNDRFDPVRQGGDTTLQALSEATVARRAGLSLRSRTRRSITGPSEGRWSCLRSSDADVETRLLAWAEVLLERYGVLTREVVALETSAPSWAEIAPLLARAEWRGEIRRGYFIEGLSGVQYASEEAASLLGRLAAATGAATLLPTEITLSMTKSGQESRSHDRASEAALVLICTTDPANIYGAGAPLDIDLLEGGVARLPRSGGNFLVLREGRPVLIIEAHGKRLTGLPWADRSDLDRALGFLPQLSGPARRILKVETYNGGPVAQSAVQARLMELGFVGDYPGMTYYAGWPAASTRA
jgi:ATP-dependent helicase Lhr and Lhr-like helicase